MKLYKLMVHTKTFSGEDLLINPKDFPSLKKGDIIEIYHPEDEFSRLLLQVTVFKEDLQGRDVISVEQSIAATFQLRTYADVIVNVVDPDSVALDSVEIVFKDQYLGRSEMWRLKTSLENTCVYLNKKIEFCGGSVRCQVFEMWSGGDRVACGVIVESTKVVFRSLTSMVYIFIQMSSEMWDFDIHGDLYFEKCLNGFLADLFQKWKKQSSNHEVTIVLFSRNFYRALSIDEFPQYMRTCLQRDHKGRFYEDFYRVLVQNERYDDWSHVLVELRKLFPNYQESVLSYNNRPNVVVPKAENSTAAQGNFLEVLNMSLNVFEKHHLDRSFDRTGQLSVVITPGVGVFEVDRELTNVTKQRVIDNGVGSDLVCLGEQPLHAVPLFKFHNKDASIPTDDYSMPHWINLSFYSSNKRVGYSNFVPRIKLPPRINKPPTSLNSSVRSKTVYEEEDFANVVDYQAYDDQVFTIPTAVNSKNVRHMKKTSVPSSGIDSIGSLRLTRRKLSDPDIHYSSGETLTRSPAMSIPLRPPDEISTPPFSSSEIKVRTVEDITDSPPPRPVVGSSGSPGAHFINSQILRPGRALINPFDPSHITVKLTSNRRRWTHIFPKGPTGNLIQQHHYKATESTQTLSSSSQLPGINKISTETDGRSKPRPSVLTLGGTPIMNKRGLTTLLWGATGEQEWTPALTTGVDWKSLTVPACLPITTDYFPDEVCLKTDYVFSDYNLLPEAIGGDETLERINGRKPLSTQQVFQELVSQRLAQGFQIIVEDSGSQTPSVSQAGSVVVNPKASQKQQDTTEYKLSIGRLFHRLALSGSEIRVTRYRPRHPYPPFDFFYRYRFQDPDHPSYDSSWVSFNAEKLENFNWNYLDNYICTRSDDFALLETLKYWRFRLYLIPICQAVTKEILGGAEHCDIYPPFTPEERSTITENFLRFIECFVNKIKRTQSQKKHRLDLSAFNVPNHLNRRRYSTGIIQLKSSIVGSSPFRERLGSNRLPEKPRPRSGSKVLERGRASPATFDGIVPSSSEADHYELEQEISQSITLKEDSNHSEIIDAFKQQGTGLAFLNSNSTFPTYTFVSMDAIQWLMAHLEGITSHTKAMVLLQSLVNEKFICHASGDFSVPFLSGFYMYYIVKTNKDEYKGDPEPVGDHRAFENEWAEVEVKLASDVIKDPPFLCSTLPPFCSQMDQTDPLFKECNLDIDVSNKSDRIEWGHLKYHAVYRPDLAYEFVIKWMAASGSIVADLVFGWARKAQTCGLLLVPVPADPFALPYSLNAASPTDIKPDPLRGPVFISLETECLMGTKSYLFEDFPEETWATRLVLFQEAIAMNFGFFLCSVEGSHQHNQYVHLSGNVFLSIQTPPCVHKEQRQISRNKQIQRIAVSGERISSQPEGIVRQGPQPRAHEAKIGFLWSWNYMVSRRWRLGPTSAIGDEPFQNKLLADFKKFCSNEGNRLKNFWDSSWSKISNK